jgi:hypothetical protein
MIEEQYVSFEVAKLLKEKGFDVSCYGRYSVRSKEFHLDTTKPCNNGGISQYSAPTQQMAMAWLREIHNIHIDICSIWDNTHWLYQVFVVTPRTARNSYVDKTLYTSYEQAAEAGIKYCLENLI